MEASEIDFLTKEQVREHLRNLGFHNVPDHLLEEFILDIVNLDNTPKQNKAQSHRQTAHQVQRSLESDFQQHQKENRHHYHENFDPETSSIDDRNSKYQSSGQFSGYSADEFSEYSQYEEPVYTKNKVDPKRDSRSYQYKHKQGQSRNQNGWNTYSTTTTFKKTDPVARYHKLQSVWNKDNFLKHLDKPRRNLGVPFPVQSQYQKSVPYS